MGLEKNPDNASVKQAMLLVLFLLTVSIHAQDVKDTLAAKPVLPTVDEQVAALIEKTMNKETEHQAFYDLETLGCSAVPAIINQMDDRRKLPDRRITLKVQGSDKFLLNMAPEEVVDALAAILNQITRRYFGFIYNGATDTERTKTVRRWQKFLRTTPTTDLCLPPPKEMVIFPYKGLRQVHVRFIGSKQGDFNGNVVLKNQAGWSRLIKAVATSDDERKIVKQVDSSSPQLQRALATDEMLEIVIRIRVSSTTRDIGWHRLKVTGIKRMAGHRRKLEEITFVFIPPEI